MMYHTPQLSDFQRNLDSVIHDAEHAARANLNQVQSEHISRGIAQLQLVCSHCIVFGGLVFWLIIR